ncbi:MAG: DNA polymerase III subunit alpha [Gammaproteobacteria bacterium]|nr:DNA polymerase III subunit alpha [Gammaproteobacteria bacterium]
MSSRFAHLRVRTEYAIQDSIVRIEPLIDAVVELGMDAVGVSDFCNFFAVVKIYQAALSKGVKPLIGVDLPCCFRDSPDEVTILSVLCQNLIGYRHVTQLISKAYLEGQAQGSPRVYYEWLPEFSEGLIVLSGAHLGWVDAALLKGDFDQAIQRATTLSEWFPQRFYLEIQRIGLPHEASHHVDLVRLADQLNLPLVATNGVRFLKPHEYDAHEARVCIHEGRTLADSRQAKRYTHQQYLRSADEMVTLFEDLPQAIENAVQIVKRCTVKLQIGQSFLPAFPVPAHYANESVYLEELARAGLVERLQQVRHADEAVYLARLDLELKVIGSMGFPGYFLIVADFIGWSKSQGIRVGPGRGSGAGSLVAYALKITDLDPLAYDLLFERFLNPERVSMPDFDVDFCMAGRDRVIEYVADKYGRHCVSQIITFGSMAAKAVVRDVGRVLSHPYGFVDKLAKLIPFEIGMTLDKALEDSAELKQRYDDEEEVKELFDLALILEGLVRNPGKHAGGVVIAPSALTDFTAIYCEAGSNQLVSQFDKDDVEAAGLVKFDFLGLRTLTIIDGALLTINRLRAQQGIEPLVIEHLPLDCEKTVALLQSCQTSAVFQLESRGMKELIHRLQPDSFEDLIALVALFRPGPLQSGMVDDFINRKHGRAQVSYAHPDLESILKPTYGVILYQEQVMQIAQVLASYTLGAADLLRRAMGKKKPEEMAKQRTIFIEGAKAREIDEEVSGHIFDLMEKFAGYGFNKSHSAAYALISYQTAWLKAHYPAAFMSAVLSADMDHTDKVVFMIEECKQMHLAILPPSIERSDYQFSVEEERAIRYGLGAIKGVGEAAIELIVEERAQGGAFQGLFDFCCRMDLRKLNRRVVEALIKSGSMDVWGQDRAVLIASLEKAIQVASQYREDRQFGQLDLFNALDHQFSQHAYVDTPVWTMKEKLNYEKDTLGLYFSGHPTSFYHEEFRAFVTLIAELNPRKGKKAMVCVLVTGRRTVTTKRGKQLSILSVEDGSGKFDVVMFEEVAARYQSSLVSGEVMILEGDISIDDFNGKVKMLANSCYSLIEARGKWVKQLLIRLRESDATRLAPLQAMLSTSPGETAIEVVYQNGRISAKMRLGKEAQVAVSDELLSQLRGLLGAEQVLVCY